MSYVTNDDYLNWVLDKGFRPQLATHRDPLSFYPSNASAIGEDGNHYGACIRAAYYDRSLIEPDAETDIAGLMIMMGGSAIGDRLSKLFQNAGVAVAPNGTEGEQRVYVERTTPNGVKYRIGGYIDQICRGPNNELLGYEFKTIWSSGKANRVIKGWRCTPAPDVKNVMQTAIYADFARPTWGIIDWKLTYFHIESKSARTYNITVDNDGKIYVDGQIQMYTMAGIYSQYDKLADAIATDIPPEREGQLWLTTEELEQLAINDNLTKKQMDAYKNDRKALKAWSPCTYCNFIGTCYSKEDQEEAVAAR